MIAANPLIISVAPNGSHAQKADNPAVPYSAREIADEIIRAAEAGAAIAHVHARTPDGHPTQEVSGFREIVELVQKRSDIILELSLGSYGFGVEEALAPLALHPPMASLPMQVRKDAERGDASLDATARMLLERGVRPGLAVTSIRTRTMVLDLIGRALAGSVPCVGVAVEPFASLGEASKRLLQFTKEFPEEVHWWLVKGSKSGATQYALRALAIGLGGHVRVGFEDMVQTYDGRDLAPANAWYVSQMVELSRSMGRPVAKPEEARRILDLG